MIVKMRNVTGHHHLGLIAYRLIWIADDLRLVAIRVDISDSCFINGRLGPGGI
jgi:hypothetical protein